MTDAETTGEPTLDMMMEAANALKGSYFAEISLGYHPGVTNGKHWLCSVEADIRGAMFGLWASTPQEAVRHTSAEAIRRVPVVANADLPVISEWYSRDAWVLSSSILAGNGSEVDVADIIGATRRSSNESVFISRSELGWALSRLVVGGLLSITDGGFTPSARALELWSQAVKDWPLSSGSGCTRRLLDEMRTDEPAIEGELHSWRISEVDYLTAIQNHISQLLAERA